MTKNVRIGLLVLVVLCGGSVVFASQTVFEGSSPPTCSFVNYLHVGGGGEAFIEDEMAILLDVSYGFRLSPSLSLGAFIAVNPLSNFAHADLGLSIANTDAAYAMMSGMEMLFTFSPDSLVHPPSCAWQLEGSQLGILRMLTVRRGGMMSHSPIDLLLLPYLLALS